MEIQTATAPEIPRAKNTKRMASCVRDGDWTLVSMNSSSLDLIQTCLRKAKYTLIDGWRAKNESPATVFGSSIHKALEVWYSTPRENRNAETPECMDVQSAMLSSQPQLPIHPNCARCASVFAFLQRGEALHNQTDEKRSLENGIVILNSYFDKYLHDPFVVFRDDLGPVCERDFELPFVELPELKLRINLFGTIDVVLHDQTTKSLVVCDHKTTSNLGPDFLNRLNPNFQYFAYSWAAHRMWGIDSGFFLVNGIQVAKTVRNFSRQFVKIGETQYAELQRAVVYATHAMMHGNEFGWPQNAPNPCSMYGGCHYRRVCEVPDSLRASVLMSLFERADAG